MKYLFGTLVNCTVGTYHFIGTQYYDQLTVMCTTRGERRLISIRCQMEFVESRSDGHTGSHSDYNAL